MEAISKKAKSNPMTTKQREILIDFISSRKEMYTGKLTPSYTKDSMKTMWQQLSDKLNSVPGGSAKEWQQWRKTWVDLKKNSKAKIAAQKKYSVGTGGGPPPTPVVDDKLLGIITGVCVSGNGNVTESEVLFEEPPLPEHYYETHSPEPYEITTETTEVKDNIPSLDLSQSSLMEVINDHDYMSDTRGDTSAHNAGMANKQEDGRHPKKNRVTKTTRLTESLKNNATFLKLTEKSSEGTLQLKKEKIEVLKKDSDTKAQYYKKKLAIFERFVGAIESMATDVMLIRQNLEQN